MKAQTTIQMVIRKNQKQFIIAFPVAIAKELNLQKGEKVAWEIGDKNTLTSSPP